MKIFHIVNGFVGSPVYENLFKQLDSAGITQVIYIPLSFKNRKQKGKVDISFSSPESRIIYTTLLGRRHRYLYDSKIKRIIDDVFSRDILKGIALIHASTWCFDGAIAYRLSQATGIPFVVSIRNTDLNVYYKVLHWRRAFFSEILMASSRIIFISKQYYLNFKKIVQKIDIQALEEKITIIPNGIASIYFQDGRSFQEIRQLNQPVKVLYVGGIQKNKNLHTVIKSIKILRDKGLNISYTAYGKGLQYHHQENRYLKKIHKLQSKYSWVSILPAIKTEALKKIYKDFDIFIMLSFVETFGLVYIEALTQGLPVLYSKGQGFDNMFEQGLIGYSANPKDKTDICNKIEMIINNYGKIKSNINALNFTDFSWEEIGYRYLKLYINVLSYVNN